MPWPIGADFQDAIQTPAASLADPVLRVCTPALDQLGLPRASTGNFAIVFQLREPSGRRWAIRCFLRDLPDHEHRYAQISRHLRAAGLRCGVGFEFLSTGLRVDGRWYPALKMEWIDGVLLHTYIENTIADHVALRKLAGDWLALVRELKVAGVAHGDLQHRNVIVAADGALKLVDYDAMYVPALAGLASHEIGNPSYQHPRRASSDYGPELDRFSALAIYTALLAVEQQPELWPRFSNGDNLLFRRDDFLMPSASPLFAALGTLRDAQMVTCVSALRAACLADLPQVPDLQALLRPGRAPSAQALPSRKPEWIADWISRPLLPPTSFDFAFDPAWTRPDEEARHVVRREATYRQRTRQVRHYVTTARGWVVLTLYVMAALAVLLAYPGIWTSVPLLLVGWAMWRSRQRWQGARTVTVSETSRERTGFREVRETVKVRLPGHSGPVLAVTFSPDGTLVCSGGVDGVARCWDRETGGLQRVLAGHGRDVTSVARTSAGRVVTGSRDHTVRVWRSRGSPERTLRAPLGSLVNAVATSDDGRLVAAAIGQKLVCVWGVADGRQWASLPGHTRKVLAVAFCPGGRRLVSGSADMSLRVWDLDMKRCEAVLQGHSGEVTCVAVSADGNWIASGGSDGLIILWDARSGAEVLRVSGRAAAVLSLAFSADGGSLVYGAPDGSIRCRSIALGQEAGCLSAHNGAVRGVALSPDGCYLASCGDDGRVRTWKHR